PITPSNVIQTGATRQQQADAADQNLDGTGHGHVHNANAQVNRHTGPQAPDKGHVHYVHIGHIPGDHRHHRSRAPGEQHRAFHRSTTFLPAPGPCGPPRSPGRVVEMVRIAEIWASMSRASAKVTGTRPPRPTRSMTSMSGRRTARGVPLADGPAAAPAAVARSSSMLPRVAACSAAT